MTTEELLIHQLAARAGVSVRTIRYYIEEGLLPQPSYQGKYSYYTLNYLDRLELIRRLKDSYLPLREIREIMNSLNDGDVRKRLTELSLPGPKFSAQQMPAQPSTKPAAKALQYIDRLMEDQSKYRMKGTVDQTQPSFTTQKEAPPPSKISLPDFSSALPEEESWQRISLAPGVELHLHKPIDSATQIQIQQIVDFAKRVFHIKSSGGIK